MRSEERLVTSLRKTPLWNRGERDRRTRTENFEVWFFRSKQILDKETKSTESFTKLRTCCHRSPDNDPPVFITVLILTLKKNGSWNGGKIHSIKLLRKMLTVSAALTLAVHFYIQSCS